MAVHFLKESRFFPLPDTKQQVSLPLQNPLHDSDMYNLFLLELGCQNKAYLTINVHSPKMLLPQLQRQHMLHLELTL